MNQFFTNAKDGMLRYRLAIARGILYSISSIIFGFMASVANVDFPALSAWKQSIIILAVVGNWTTIMIAYLDKILASPPPNPEPTKEPNP